VNYSRIEKSAALSPNFKNAMKLRKEACVRYKIKLASINSIDEAPDPLVLVDEIVKISEDMDAKAIFSTVREFDKRAGIEYLYDQQIMDPYLTVFGNLSNPEYDSVKLAGDATQYDLIRASRDREKLAAVKDKLGDKFASEFNNNPIMSIEKLNSPEKTVLSVITR